MALQTKLSEKIIFDSSLPLSKIRTVAGIDVHYRGDLAFAAIVVLDRVGSHIVETATAKKKVTYPYIPGMLSFREGPVILSALEKLKVLPELLIFDGHGWAHPRRLGIACHLGLLMDTPSVGCAKTRLIGQHSEPEPAKGAYAYLKDRGKVIGAALRTRDKVKPVYVSCGHRINLNDSIRIILECCTRYRLPEPIRRADALARQVID